MRASLPKTSRAVTFELALACELGAVRPAAVAVRDFLAEQGLHEEETLACELALAEACNNAIQYAPSNRRSEPIEVKAICNGSKVELYVKDHTAGFEWPANPALPRPDCERGRGLFLIQSLMQSVNYLRGREDNTLVMAKARRWQGCRHAASEAAGDLAEARRRLSECERVITDMARELCVRTESLSAIFRCSAEMGRAGDLKEFAQRLLNDLLHITSADWFVLRLAARDAQLELLSASEPGLGLTALPLDRSTAKVASAECEAARRHREVWFDPAQPLDTTDPLAALSQHSSGVVCPLFLQDRLVGTLAVGRELVDAKGFSASEAEVVRTFAGFLAIQFVNAAWQAEQVNSRLVAQELEIARNIQRALLPKSLPTLPGFSLAAFLQSARQVGGDLYDVLRVSDHSALLMVADVMGKGVPAAMFAAILRSLVRVVPEWTRRPSELLSKMNRLLFPDLSAVEMFITAQLVFVDVRDRSLTAASAGHCPLLLASASPAGVRTISPEGMPLGILPGTIYTDEIVPLGPSCRLLLYTDGVTETRNAAGECFGQERLSSWLQQTLAQRPSAEDLKADLVTQLAAFQPPDPLRDDQTFLLLAETAAAA